MSGSGRRGGVVGNEAGYEAGFCGAAPGGAGTGVAVLHVFIGTKAQYVKCAPLLARLEERGVGFRLIDSGQHAALAEGLRSELGVRPPDFRLGGDGDVTSVAGAAMWAAGLLARWRSPSRLRAGVFGGRGGMCLVHGDTPSTWLGMVLARRGGLAVAHLESGLRSRSWFHPFPEEIIRHRVARRADVLLAPDAVAVANLEEMGARGRVVNIGGNTGLETLRRSAQATQSAQPAGTGAGVVTMHRVENLHRSSRREGLMEAAAEAAGRGPVRWVLHDPTRRALGEGGLRRLTEAGVELSPLVGHARFAGWLAAAPWVITDGGSVQEECALLGVPTLLWRNRTERPDGLGANITLSRYDRTATREFLADPQRYRRPPAIPQTSPSDNVIEALSEWL